MQKQNKAIILTLAVAMLSIMPFVMATVTLNTPVTGTNYTTLTFNCSKDAIGSVPINATSVEIWYNASGGDAFGDTRLGTITNTSTDQIEFVSSISIESLTDGISYNFSCLMINSSGVNNGSSVGISSVGIDNTNPTYTFVLSKSSKADYKGTQRLTWTTADATSGVETVSVNVTSPNSDTCPIQTWTTTSGTDTQVDLKCTGSYTAGMTVTDNAGNSVSTTDPFKVYAPGEKQATSEGVTFGTYSIGGEGEGVKLSRNTLAIIAVIVFLIWIWRKN